MRNSLKINFILKGNKITFNQENWFKINKKIIEEYELFQKNSIDEAQYKKLMNRVVRDYSIYLLGKRDYFKKELKEKLYSIFYHKESVENQVELLGEEGYINDYDYGKIYINNHRNYGEKKLEYILFLKGLRKSEITQLLKESEGNQYNEIVKKIGDKNGDELKKIVQSLMRKGFQYGVIKKIIDERGSE